MCPCNGKESFCEPGPLGAAMLRPLQIPCFVADRYDHHLPHVDLLNIQFILPCGLTEPRDSYTYTWGAQGEANGDRTRSEQRTKTNVRSENSERAGFKHQNTFRATRSESHDQVERVRSEQHGTFRTSSSERILMLESSTFAIFRTRVRFCSLFRTCSITVRLALGGPKLTLPRLRSIFSLVKGS